jgi:Protein of unknown function (DUF835)
MNSIRMGCRMSSSDSLDTIISASVDTSAGCAYLVEERRPKQSLELCEKLSSDGTELLVVSRDPPSQLISRTILTPKKTIWLTNLVGKDRMDPTSIGILMGEIRKFVERPGRRSIVLIDGLEYLISLNTYDRMLQFVHQLRDMFVMAGAVLIMPVDMRTLNDREQALLERNLNVISSPAILSGDMESSENLFHVPSGEGIGT